MADKADERWRQRLDIRNPERKVGTTATGDPIWMDMREIFSSPSEDAERWGITLANRKEADVNKAAYLVLHNAGLFLEQTIYNVSKEFAHLHNVGDYGQLEAWLKENRFEAIQDGLTTYVKKNGKILRTMTAKVPEAWRVPVALRVKQLVREVKLT